MGQQCLSSYHLRTEIREQANILVVDDEPGIRITLAKILGEEGYNVIVAENGYQGNVAA